MSEQENEKAIFTAIHELITTMEDNLDKKAKFVRLFEERADENAMKIWKECFKEAYEGKQ
jgi:hypothetical protein